MNQVWSDANKSMQLLLKKRETFSQGIDELLALRKALMQQVLRFRQELSSDDFYAMPYPNAKGYHSKTLAYSLWHIFRIEDIVTHTLMAGAEQVFCHGHEGLAVGQSRILIALTQKFTLFQKGNGCRLCGRFKCQDLQVQHLP